MMKKLDELVMDQQLLKKIKIHLMKNLREQQLVLGKASHLVQAYANKVADRLIPYDQEGKLEVTGLRHIYYNCPANLWPISGPVNRSKGKKESIKISISFVFKRIQELLGNKQVKSLAIKTAKQFGVHLDEIKIKTNKKREKTIELLSAAILKKFNEECEGSGSKDQSILPYIVKDREVISMLSFFQKTPIGEMSKNFSREIAINAKKSLMIARDIAFHAMAAELIEDDPTLKKLQSINKGAIQIFKIFCKSLRKELDQSLSTSSIVPLLTREQSSSSDSSLNSLGIKTMSFVATDLMNAVDESEQKLKRKREYLLEVTPIDKLADTFKTKKINQNKKDLMYLELGSANKKLLL